MHHTCVGSFTGADNLAEMPDICQTCYRNEAEAAMHLRFGRGADTAA